MKHDIERDAIDEVIEAMRDLADFLTNVGQRHDFPSDSNTARLAESLNALANDHMSGPRLQIVGEDRSTSGDDAYSQDDVNYWAYVT
ncbi:MAG: hypothetical protein AAF686_01745 [Pseudomonadota bacterium]